MPWSLRSLRKIVFSISLEETTFERRGFRGNDTVTRQRLEQVGRVFLLGYHAALDGGKPEELVPSLEAVEPEFRGFAFEGAAMSLALLDRLSPWRRNRLRVFLEGPGAPHAYMVHVGAGWALARLGGNVERSLARLDPLLRWLAVDGYGFHEGYFHWPRYVEGHANPERLSGYGRRVFDQGLGRSLWFVDGADVARIPETIAAFPSSRHADLWSGVGLACADAGGGDQTALEALRAAAEHYRFHLAQGAAFAAKARQRAGNPAAPTERACTVLCGVSAGVAANITDLALKNLPPDCVEPAYEVWRRRIRGWFAKEAAIS
jgi:hypothetical protein